MRKKEFKNYLDPSELGRNFLYKQQWAIEHPDYFYPDGCTVFCGAQGSGKTMSAMKYIHDLMEKYPKCIICSNVPIDWVPENKFFTYTGFESFEIISNGEQGVIYFLDEMHLEFNSLESKGMPPMMFKQISQQRKQRKHIVGTAQVFMRLAKPFREQMDTVVVCKNLFNIININAIASGDSVREMPDGKLSMMMKKRYALLHGPTLYGNYDTKHIVSRLGKEWRTND